MNWRLEEQEEGCRLAALAGGEAAAALPVFREAKMKGGFCALGVRHMQVTAAQVWLERTSRKNLKTDPQILR